MSVINQFTEGVAAYENFVLILHICLGRPNFVYAVLIGRGSQNVEYGNVRFLDCFERPVPSNYREGVSYNCSLALLKLRLNWSKFTL